MAYNSFTIEQIETQFGIKIQTIFHPLFEHLKPYLPSQHLQETLGYNVPLATAIHTEKARSEMIITPIIVELKKITNNQISFFSGIEFNVNPEQGLNGRCDYILSLNKEQSILRAPVVTLVEAKNDNIPKGIGQCAAEMIAANIFNEQNNRNIDVVYGVITTGSLWKFLKLENGIVYMEAREYQISNIEVILGVLLRMLKIDDAKLEEYQNIEEPAINYWTTGYRREG